MLDNLRTLLNEILHFTVMQINGCLLTDDRRTVHNLTKRSGHVPCSTCISDLQCGNRCVIINPYCFKTDMSGSEIPQYSSSEDSAAGVLEESEPKKRRKKVDKQWKREQVFSNKALAQKSLKDEGIWSFYHKNVDTVGNVSAIYRCNKVKYRGEQCASGVYLYYPANTEDVVLYRSELLHTCESIPSKTTIQRTY
jgi:hypothetical protein